MAHHQNTFFRVLVSVLLSASAYAPAYAVDCSLPIGSCTGAGCAFRIQMAQSFTQHIEKLPFQVQLPSNLCMSSGGTVDQNSAGNGPGLSLNKFPLQSLEQARASGGFSTQTYNMNISQRQNTIPTDVSFTYTGWVEQHPPNCNPGNTPPGGTLDTWSQDQGYPDQGKPCSMYKRTSTCPGDGSGIYSPPIFAFTSCHDNPGLNAACGSAHGGSFYSTPSTNLCADGSTPAVATGGSSCAWTPVQRAGHPCDNNSCDTCATVIAGAGSCSAGNAGTIAGICNGFVNGTYNNVTCSCSGSSSTYSWTCAGQNGGTSANCSATQRVDCVGSWSACASGTQTYTIATPALNGGLSCPYANGASQSCGTPATCGTANGASVSSAPTSGLCSTGTASAVTGTGPWNWSCASVDGGSSAACSATTAGPYCWSLMASYTSTFDKNSCGGSTGACSTPGATANGKCELLSDSSVLDYPSGSLAVPSFDCAPVSKGRCTGVATQWCRFKMLGSGDCVNMQRYTDHTACMFGTGGPIVCTTPESTEMFCGSSCL